MTRPLILGNWKMALGIAQACKLAIALIDREAEFPEDVDLGICPSTLHLLKIVELVDGTGLLCGGQDLVSQAPGAVTGGTSAEQLAEIGVDYVLVGHSERREFFRESGEELQAKLKAALRVGLSPVLCVGESLEVREAGGSEEFVLCQLEEATSDLSQESLAALTIAYEPIWAIGTGRSAAASDASAMHAVIRRAFAKRAGTEVGRQLRILYGGSVKPANIDEYMAAEGIDGALVGGASLEAESFLRIARFGLA